MGDWVLDSFPQSPDGDESEERFEAGLYLSLGKGRFYLAYNALDCNEERGVGEKSICSGGGNKIYSNTVSALAGDGFNVLDFVAHQRLSERNWVEGLRRGRRFGFRQNRIRRGVGVGILKGI